MALVKYNNRKSPSMFNPFFDDFLMKELHGKAACNNQNWGRAATNVVEDDINYRIEIIAPGRTKESFEIELTEEHLNISSKLEKKDKSEKEKFTRKEFSLGNFKRSFILPKDADKEKIDAKYTNGILIVKLPKSESTLEKAAKQIKVS